MDFLALDFETATQQPDSPCELGIAVVRGGVVREVRNWLIKPRYWPFFSPWNVAVHGIRPEDVAEAPRWEEVWGEVSGILEGATIVAHNASFDMSVLRATLATHRLPHPTFQYFCSVSMARRMWPGRTSYGLKPMCAYHGIPLKHHRAGNDAEATAELVLRATDGHSANDMVRFLSDVGLKVGGFYPGGHRTPGGKIVSSMPY
ncbi:MAG: 3'-5' exonuclease [Flavobacteriales bacterium]|nr:3'-5' exonuclease [Flavobacteriales bacterium]